MPLLPSLRQKKRYVVFEIISDRQFSLAEVKESVLQALAAFFGQQGLAKASPLFLAERFNPQKQRFVLKINHRSVDELKAALMLCTAMHQTPIIIRSLTTSGTLKKAGQFLSM